MDVAFQFFHNGLIMPQNPVFILEHDKDTIIQIPPKMNIITKSAVRPRNEPSSSIRQYRYVNIMLKKKLKPTVPKNKKVVTSRHS
jgi:hypothetical protein